MIDIRLLGRFSVHRDAVEIPAGAFGGRLVRALVRILVIHRGAFLSREVLAEALWPKQSPANPGANLSVIVNRARRALGDASLILTGPGGYSFTSDNRCHVDAESFLAGVEAGRRQLASGHAEAAIQAFGAALVLWSGEPLAEDAYEDWAQAYQTRLARAHLEALESGSAAALQAGDLSQAVALAERAVAREPLREAAHLSLVRALATAGDTAGALAVLDRLRQRFIEELGLNLSPEAAAMEIRLLRGELHAGSSRPATVVGSGDTERPANSMLPAGERPQGKFIGLEMFRTSFIGRERELAELCRLLGTSRLITVVGTDGIGKSQLIREVGIRQSSSFSGGICLVELGAVTDASLVPRAIAALLRVKELPQRSLVHLLTERLRDAELLLVLEDCDHVRQGVGDVTDRLIRACPNLRIIATSRAPLGVAGETIHTVGGLTLPEPGAATPGLVGRVAAVRLFVERAAMAQPEFRLTTANASAVAETCRLLHGVPLAIAVAATWVSKLPADFTADIESWLRSATPGGSGPDASLRAVIEGSVGMLGELEQRLLLRLCVFAGDFTLEAVEGVCAEPGQRETERLLARLVDHSLVAVSTAEPGSTRYRLPETVRTFARERLQARGESERLCRRHAAFFLAFAERASDALWGLDRAGWFGRLETEQPNLRAALAWGLEQHDPEIAVRLAGALAQFWAMQGHYMEGGRWLDRALAAEGPVSSSARARALLGAAALAASERDPGRGTEARELAVLSRGEEGLSWRVGRGTASWIPGDAERAAAWRMYVELVTRIGVQELPPEEGMLREALSSLYTLFSSTRQILQGYGPSVAATEQGSPSFALIAMTMLNRALRPLLTPWHAELARHESQRPPEVTPLDHEREWARAQALRQAIAELQPILVSYANLLSTIAGVPPLAS